MFKRVASTGCAFAAAALVTTQLCGVVTETLLKAPPATTPAHAVIGLAAGLLAGYLAWNRSATAPESVASAQAGARAAALQEAPSSTDPAQRWRSAVQFGVMLILVMVLISAWTGPQNGLFRIAPSFASLTPALLVAGLATAMMRRDARRRSGASDPLQTDRLAQAASAVGSRFGRKAADAAAGSLGATLSTTASGARGLGRLASAYRSGGAAVAGQADWGVLGPLFAIGVLFFTIGLMQDAGPAIIIAGIAFGGAAAVSYDHETAPLFRLRRLPDMRGAALLALCFVTLLWLMVSIEMALAPPSLSHPTPLALGLTYTGKVLGVLGQALVAAPLLAALAREAPPADEQRPLWPLLAALVGGEIALVVLAAQWDATTAPAFEAYPNWAAAASGAIAFPPLGLLLGAGLITWYQALTAHRRAGFDWETLFPASIRGCMAFMAFAVIGCIITQAAPTQSWKVGQAEAGMITGLLWLYVLWQIVPMRPASAMRGLLGWVTITVTFYLAAFAGYLVGAGDDWAGLLIIFTLPIAIASWVLTVKLVPRLIRRVLG